MSTTHQEGSSARLHQDRRHNARLPGHDASWTGHTTTHPGIQQAALGQQLHRPFNAEVPWLSGQAQPYIKQYTISRG